MGGRRILVVDDDVKIRGFVAGLLRQAGYEVHATETAKGALRLAHEVKPDLAILDIMMPDVDGFQLAFELRDTPETAKIPYLFLTARKAEEGLSAARDLGAVAYLEKPFKKEAILHIVAELLQEKPPRHRGTEKRRKGESEKH